MKRKVLNIIYIVIITILISITALLVYQKVVFFNAMVVGSSMHGTLEEGQVGAVTKIQFVSSIDKGNIIVFERDKSSDYSYEVIKRVIATPGDHIVLNDNKVYINDTLLEEKYISEDNKNQITNHGNNTYYDITLKEDEYYVMGDNRKNSYDSRYYGVIKKDQIRGKLKVIYAEYDCENSCDTYSNKRSISWKFF